MKRGFSVLDIVVSIFVMGLILVILVNLQNIFNSNIKQNRVETHVLQLISNTITDLDNAENWENIETYTENYRSTKITVEYNYKGITKHNTHKVEVKFKYGGKERTIEMERSIYE